MEEPISQQVYGFLLTENINDVLPTILSRSQIVHLKSIDEQDLKLELINQGVDENVAGLAPYVTKNIDEALALSDQPNFIEMINLIEELVRNWSNKNISFPLYFSENAGFLVQDRDFFMNFLELLLLYYLDLIHYKAHQEIVYTHLKEYIQIHSDQLTTETIQDIIEGIQDILKRQSYFINLELALDQLANLLEKKR